MLRPVGSFQTQFSVLKVCFLAIKYYSRETRQKNEEVGIELISMPVVLMENCLSQYIFHKCLGEVKSIEAFGVHTLFLLWKKSLPE